MKHKRLNRDKWGFQFYPYYQMRLDIPSFCGTASLIRFTDGEKNFWDFPKAGKVQVTGEGMTWMQLLPDNENRMITVPYFPDGTHDPERKAYPKSADPRYQPSEWYIDVAEGHYPDSDGVEVYIDAYLDVMLTPEGDVVIDDRDELEAAYESGDMTKEQYELAQRECDRILADYQGHIPDLDRWCAGIREEMEKRIAAGEPVLKGREILTWEKEHNQTIEEARKERAK